MGRIPMTNMDWKKKLIPGTASDILIFAMDSLVVCYGIWTLYCHSMVFSGRNFDALVYLSFVPVLLSGLILYTLLNTGGKTSQPEHRCDTICLDKIAQKARIPLPIKIALALLIALAYPLIENYLLFFSISILFYLLVIYDNPSDYYAIRQTKRAPISKWSKGGICILIILAIFITLFACRPDADDAHYLGFVISALDFPEKPLLRYDSMFGEKSLSLFSDHYRVHTYELFVALISSLSHLDFRVIYYLILPAFSAILLVLFHAMAIHQIVGKNVFWGLVITLTILFAWGDTHHSFGNFAFVRLFQNKGILVSICIPAIVYYASRFSLKNDIQSWLLLFFSQIVAFGIAGTGILIAPIASFLVLLAYWKPNILSTRIFITGFLSSTYLLITGLFIVIYGFTQILTVIPLFTLSLLLLYVFCLKKKTTGLFCVVLAVCGLLLSLSFQTTIPKSSVHSPVHTDINRNVSTKRKVVCQFPRSKESPIFSPSSNFRVVNGIFHLFNNGRLSSNPIFLPKGYYKVVIRAKGNPKEHRKYIEDHFPPIKVQVLSKYGSPPSAAKTVQLTDQYRNIEGPIFPALTQEYTIAIRIGRNPPYIAGKGNHPHILLEKVSVEPVGYFSIARYWWEKIQYNTMMRDVFGTKSRATIVWFAFLAFPIIFSKFISNNNVVRFAFFSLLITFNPIISTFLPICIGIQQWRLLWACPIPLLIGLAGAGCITTDRNIWHKSLRNLVVFSLFMLFLLVPGKFTISTNNGTQINFPGYKVNMASYKVAEQVVALTTPNDLVLAPVSIASLIPQFHNHPRLIGVRKYFAYVKFMMDNFKESDFSSRILMFSFINRPMRFTKDLKIVLEKFNLLNIQVIVFKKDVPQKLAIKTILFKNFKPVYQAHGYEIWERWDSAKM